MLMGIAILFVLINGPFALLFMIHLMLGLRNAAIRSVIGMRRM